MGKRLLAVLAHPDDESFGLGGTLARYAAEGADVHIAIATDGVAGSVAAGFEDKLASLVEVRGEELARAADVLGGKVHMLGYRDSGYIGDPANLHPEAFANIDPAISTAAVVNLIRHLRPQVVITHDETGGYFHPDHIKCWEVTTAAFFTAGDPERYVDVSVPYQPQRLFYTAFPNRMVWFYTFLMRLRGQDPTKMGRNKDIDFTKLGISGEKLHARIDYGRFWDTKRLASAQHASQGGGTSNSRALPEWFQRRFLASEYFIRAFPPANDGYRIDDLFEGVDLAA